MKYVKLGTRLFIFLLLLLTMFQNVDQHQAVTFLWMEFSDLSLAWVLCLSFVSGLFIGFFIVFFKLVKIKKDKKLMQGEISALKKEVDSHRNVVVQEILGKDGNTLAEKEE